MPIEIGNLVTRVVVDETLRQNAEPAPHQASVELNQECVRQVLQILRKERER